MRHWLTALLLAATVLPAAESESVRPTAHWLCELTVGDESRIDTALDGLLANGPEAAEAVPILLSLLASPSRRCKVVEALGAIGPAASEALPAILPWCRHRRGSRDYQRCLRTAACAALARIGRWIPAARWELFLSASDPDDAYAGYGRAGLDLLGPEAEPEARRALREGGVTMQAAAREWLSRLASGAPPPRQPERKDVVPELSKPGERSSVTTAEPVGILLQKLARRLEASNDAARDWSGQTTGYYGDATARHVVGQLLKKESVPGVVTTAMIDLLADRTWPVSRDTAAGAATVLSKIGEPAIEGLAESLDGAGTRLRRRVLLAMQSILRSKPLSNVARETVRRSLMRLLDAGDPEVRRHALYLLAEYKLATSGDEPVLSSVMREPDGDMRQLADRALRSLELGARRDWPPARYERDENLRRLTTENEAGRLVPGDARIRHTLWAAKGAGSRPNSRAVARLTRVSEEAVQTARVLLSGANDSTRLEFVETLCEEEAELRALASELAALVSADDARISGHARTVLLRLGKDCVPVLVAKLAFGDVRHRRDALAVLELAGSGARDAAREVGRALKDEDLAVRLLAARVLEGLGSAAAPAAPALLASAQSGPRRLRIAALRGLGAIGDDARWAVPALQSLSRDPASEVMEESKDAASRILGSNSPKR